MHYYSSTEINVGWNLCVTPCKSYFNILRAEQRMHVLYRQVLDTVYRYVPILTKECIYIVYV